MHTRMVLNAIEELYGPDLRRLKTAGIEDGTGNRSIGAAEIREGVQLRRARFKSLGPPSGLTFGLWTSPPSEFMLTYLGCLAAGHVAVPLDPKQSPRELLRRLELTRCQAVLAEEPHPTLDVLSETLPVSSIWQDPDGSGLPHDSARGGAYPIGTAQVLFTSGSTGPSKAAVITHENLLSNTQATIEWSRYTSGDMILSALPMFHCYTLLHCVLSPLATGAASVLHGAFSSESFLRAVDEKPVTVLPLVPAIAELILRNPTAAKVSWSPLRYALSGGAVLPPATQRAFSQLTGAPLLNGYGMTEATSFVSAPPVDMHCQAPNSIGWPVKGVEVRVRDLNDEAHEIGSGELEVGGRGVMRRYLDDADATAQTITEDGWLRTGDQVRIEENGELFYLGRLKNVINRGGEKIHPETVESIFHDLSWVGEAAAVGLPHPVLGEQVACLIACSESDFDARAILRECLATLATYEVPSVLIRVDDLPRNPAGKIVRREVLRLAETLLGNPSDDVQYTKDLLKPA